MTARQNDTERPVMLAVTTFPDPEQASQIGTELVQSQLAACINVLPGATSIYRWQGEVEQEGEIIALMKTTADRFEDLKARLTELHPYDEPELIALDVTAGTAGYLDWVRECVPVG